MSIAIREHVRVAADRSVRLSHALLEPGAEAEIIVLVDDLPADRGSSSFSFFDKVRTIVIDAPEDFSTRFEDDQRL